MRGWRHLDRRRNLVLAAALVAAVLLIVALLSPPHVDIVEDDDGVASSGLAPPSSTSFSRLSSQPAGARAEKSTTNPHGSSGPDNVAAAESSSSAHGGPFVDLPTEPAFSPAPSSDAATVPEGDEQIEQPSDWCFFARTAPQEHLAPRQQYFAWSDSAVVWNGSRSVRLDTTQYGFAFNVMWQAVDATPFRDSRIRVSARVRSASYATKFFVRTLETGKPEVVLEGDRVPGFQPYNQWTGGTLDWTPVEIVLDVPANADMLVYGGVMYNSGGPFWLDDVGVDRVDEKSTLTRNLSMFLQPAIVVIDPYETLDVPTNLDFEVTDRGAAARCKAHVVSRG
jgi:hypothetical protein